MATLCSGNSLSAQLKVRGQERAPLFCLLPPPRRPPQFFSSAVSHLIGRPPSAHHRLSLNCVVRRSDLRLAGCSHISAIRFATCSPNSPFLSLPVTSCPLFSLRLSRLHAVFLPSRSSRRLNPFSVVLSPTVDFSRFCCFGSLCRCLFTRPSVPLRRLPAFFSRFSLHLSQLFSFFSFLHYFAEYGRSHRNVRYKK